MIYYTYLKNNFMFKNIKLKKKNSLTLKVSKH